MALLTEMKAQADQQEIYVFPGKFPGRPLEDIKNFWQEVTALADLESIRIHDLRHTFASHLVSSGVSLPIVGKLLGHTQAETTLRYAHLADDPLSETAGAIIHH